MRRRRLFPDADLMVDHSIVSGGLFCRICGLEIGDPKTFYAALESEMRKTVSEDLPIERGKVSIESARRIFEEKDQSEKLQLLKHRKKDYLTMYRLGDYIDYHYGYMVPSTGYLRWFAIEPSENWRVLLPHCRPPALSAVP